MLQRATLLKRCCTRRQKWTFLKSSSVFTAEARKKCCPVPKIRVEFNEDLSMKITFFGWEIDVNKFSIGDPKFDTLHSILSQLDEFSLCQGVAKSDENTKLHPLLQWDSSQFSVRNIHRSPQCCILLPFASDFPLCRHCMSYMKSQGNESSVSSLDQLVKVDEDIHTAIQAVFSREQTDLNAWQQMFFSHQVTNSEKAPYARRYHPDMIRWAIELYSRSPSAYNLLRTSQVLCLPGESTIRRYRNYITPEPGLMLLAIEEIERMQAQEGTMIGYLTVDEMKIRENLVIQNGVLQGFVESGGLVNESILATQILVFYVRALNRHVSMPIAWYPTHKTPAFQLALIYWEILHECETRGLQIHALVADGLATNRTFFKLIAGTDRIPSSVFTAYNPYAPDRPVFLCSDPSHLLKTARNSLFASKPGGSRYMNFEGRDALWSDVCDLFKKEKSSLVLTKTGLTDAHVMLNPYSKMNVGLARGLMSWKVGNALREMGATGTAEYILMIARWYDIVSCNLSSCPIYSTGDERLTWLVEFAERLLKWKVAVDYTGEPKRITALPTLRGLVFTSFNFSELAKRLLESQECKFVSLGVFTQDVLEACFGNVRAHGRTAQNPDILQAGYALQHITQRKIIRKIKGNNTEYGAAANPWTSLCNEPIVKRKK